VSHLSLMSWHWDVCIFRTSWNANSAKSQFQTVPQGLRCTKDWFNNPKNFDFKFQRCVNKILQRLWLCVSSTLGRFLEVLVVHWTSCSQVLCSRKHVKQAELRFAKTHAVFIGSLSNWIFLVLYKFLSTFKIGYWTSNIIFQKIIFAEEFIIRLP